MTLMTPSVTFLNLLLTLMRTRVFNLIQIKYVIICCRQKVYCIVHFLLHIYHNVYSISPCTAGIKSYLTNPDCTSTAQAVT